MINNQNSFRADLLIGGVSRLLQMFYVDVSAETIRMDLSSNRFFSSRFDVRCSVVATAAHDGETGSLATRR